MTHAIPNIHTATDVSNETPNGTHAARDHDIDSGAQAVARAKFDLGGVSAQLPVDDIPWGYGEDRVTALARDPDWLYVYWEITDEGLADARRRLGRCGADAWCSLRVYDTTHRVFDGTNANSYVDIAIDRTSRDWFVHVGKPQSSCHVEIGMKSREGFFQRVARSGRAVFPSKKPSTDLSVEWLSVRPAVDTSKSVAAAPYVSRYDGPVSPVPAASQASHFVAPQERHAVHVGGQERRHIMHIPWRTSWGEHRTAVRSTRTSYWEHTSHAGITVPWAAASWRSEWQGEHKSFAWFGPLHRLTWSGPVEELTWELGPYPGDAAASGRVFVRSVGAAHETCEFGGGSNVFGPWEVTIRGFRAGEQPARILAAWVLHVVRPWAPMQERWEHVARRERFQSFLHRVETLGASASGHWLEWGGSELWSLGASEQLWLGASEMLLVGASELSILGASELRMAGASEMAWQWQKGWLGGSEWLGASERMVSGYGVLGASERMGSSELQMGGASESLLGGASEAYALAAAEWAGASERMG
ncbi:MAG: DUF4912 domain-containing protein, partial [Polyangiaceae bacterium]|nr:DUF4912 domain-containing protein [Polyangiaceae bacterium]